MIEVAGESIQEEQLTVTKARELANYLVRGVHPAAHLVGMYSNRDSGEETIVFDVRVELSQVRKHSVLPVERIAVSFTAGDDQLPEVVSLREDFPVVPHLNQRQNELPRSLCLYDISYDALKLRWTAATFIESIRGWLSRTAEGTLHQEDQPLEPIILGQFLPLILPATFLVDIAKQPGQRKRYAVHALVGDDTRPKAYKLVAEGAPRLTHVVTVLVAAPREHGIVRHTPSNLKDLISLCELGGLDLRAHLKAEVPRWKDDTNLRKLFMLLVIVFPKLRACGAEVTESDNPVRLRSKWQSPIEDRYARSSDRLRL